MNEKKKPDSTPAFPQTFGTVNGVDSICSDDIGYGPRSGMELRDWFAGMALIGISLGHNTPNSTRQAAKWAYEQADEMMEQRKL